MRITGSFLLLLVLVGFSDVIAPAASSSCPGFAVGERLGWGRGCVNSIVHHEAHEMLVLRRRCITVSGKDIDARKFDTGLFVHATDNAAAIENKS